MTQRLMQLGAKHAAKMHHYNADGRVHDWSPHDWELHFREEERLIFPLLPRQVVSRLARDHAIFRKQLRHLGTLDPERMHVHAQLEDEMVTRIPMDNFLRKKMKTKRRRKPSRDFRA